MSIWQATKRSKSGSPLVMSCLNKDNNHTQSSRTGRRDLFAPACVVMCLVSVLYVGSAILAVLIGGAANFTSAISDPEVLFSLRMSLVTATISTVLCLLLALPSAYALTHTQMPGKRIASVVLELTLSLPYILLGFALLLIFSSGFGQALKNAGIAVVFQPLGIVVAQLMVNLPFAIRMIRTAFLTCDPRMEFVAESLGASKWEVFRTVILPLNKNAIVSAFILTWARGMGEFGATLMLVGVTRMRTETISGSIYLSIQTGNNEVALATAIVMLLVSACALALSNVLSGGIGESRNSLSSKGAR